MMNTSQIEKTNITLTPEPELELEELMAAKQLDGVVGGGGYVEIQSWNWGGGTTLTRS